MSELAPIRPVTAVIVTYQSARTIANTLAAARRCYDENLLDVVIVDNNSSDGTRDIIGSESAWARIILTSRNNGFGRGCNIGFAQVTSAYTIFINPDAVIEPGAIRTMLGFMEQNPKAGIVGPATICRPHGGSEALQPTGHRPTPWRLLKKWIPILRCQPLDWAIVPGSAPCRTGWVCGAVLLIRTELMRRLKGFDPRFFLYWEETDLCKRAEDAGFEIWALGTALAHHVVSASSLPDHTRYAGFSIAKHYYQSRYYYMTKHHGRVSATIAELCEFVLLGLRSLVDVFRGLGPAHFVSRRQAPLLSMPEKISDER